MLIYLITGLTASAAHVISGPDHLAAVTPLSLEHRRRSWLVGLLWGTGHTLGMLVIGLIFILFREYVRMDLVSAWSDQLVGIILVVIGVWGFIRLARNHEHSAAAQQHEHPAPIRQSLIMVLAVGTLHGLAGFSHVLAVLPTLALPSPAASVVYLSAFTAGTLLTMITFTWFLGRAAVSMSQAKKTGMLKWFSRIGCSLAILVGIIWIIRPFIL